MTKPYKKHVEYSFEIDGQTILITDWDSFFVRVEEARKNGQEDTHMTGVLVRTMTNAFLWEEGEHMFVKYGSQKFADDIRQYVTQNGVPK